MVEQREEEHQRGIRVRGNFDMRERKREEWVGGRKITSKLISNLFVLQRERERGA